MNPLVYAVVTTWNNLDDTAECLESAISSSYPNLKIVLVDNGSDDGSPEVLKERFQDIPQVRMSENGSVIRAYNEGIRFSLDRGADYILMLNNDVKLDPQMMSWLMEDVEADPSIGVVTPKIYYYDQPEIIWFAGGRRSRFDYGSVDTHEGEQDSSNNNVAKEVDYAWACGMLMRSAMLEKMGLFDTRFYLYYDDVDISIRAQQAGYRIWYEPQAIMWHKVSQSTGSAHFTRIWARSKMRLYRKHAKGIHQLALVFYAFAHGAFRAVFPRNDNLRIQAHTKAYMVGLLDGLHREIEDKST